MNWQIIAVCGIIFGALVMTGAFQALHPLMQVSVTAVICMVGAIMAMLTQARAGARVTAVPLVWGLTIMVLVGSWSLREEGRIFALTLLERPLPAERTTPASLRTEVMLMRAWDGHFRAVADINETPVGLLIDTGASRVMLRYDDARRIGISDHDLHYTMPVTTANGRAFVAPVVLRRVQIGGILARDVEAAVAQPGQLHSSLLGMTFIEQLDETVIRSDRIILRD